MKQHISDRKRIEIRSDIYKRQSVEPPDFSDGKIAFFCEFAKDMTVLDLGCVDHNPENYRSRFWLHKALCAVATRCVGLDFYAPGVEALNDQGFEVVCADAQSFVLDEQFDVVTAGDLVEHLENPGGMFASSREALKPAGLFVVSSPNPWCWKYILYHIFKRRLDRINPEHVAWFCPVTLNLLGARFKFVEVEIKYFSRRWWERIIPLPAHLKHTTFAISFKKI